MLAALRANPDAQTLAQIYAYVEQHGRTLIKANPDFWKPKVRQVLQRLRDQGTAESVATGVWKLKR